MKHQQQQRGFMDLVDGIRMYQAEQFEAAHSNWGPWMSEEDDILGCFARSLASNLRSLDARSRNLYAPEGCPEERQIDLFREIGRLPHVHWPRQLTERLHDAHARSGSTHVELGIGSGEHTEQLLLASRGKTKKIIGIDLDPQSVRASGERLRRHGVEYVGIVAPFDKLDWTQLREQAGRMATVDAAFALHHLCLADKRKVLRGISSLGPRLFTLIEPSSDHWSADLLTRFVNAYSHFQIVGQLIGALEASRATRRHLLRFFGREIDDIMRDSPDRFERHEQWTFWHGELLRSGLMPKEGLQDSVTSLSLKNFHTQVSGPGVATISKGSVPLVSVCAFGQLEN